MKILWAQPSLSRDFALLSSAIFFLLVIISGGVSYTTYIRNTERITQELEKEAARIERLMAIEMENVNYTINTLGKNIVLDQDRDTTHIARILKAYDNKDYIYSILSWIDAQQYVTVSSNKGVLDTPIYVGDRDYIKKTASDPWKIQINEPIEGRVSGRWIIPATMGITNNTGKFLGTIIISIDISTIIEHIKSLVQREGISFAIINKTLGSLAQVSADADFIARNFSAKDLRDIDFVQNPSGLISTGSLFFGTGTYTYYTVSNNFSYILLLGYDVQHGDQNLHTIIWSRLVQMALVACFLVLLLWLMRARMIRPILDMAAVAESVAKGEVPAKLPSTGLMEVDSLARQIRSIGEYISETKRIENELRNKMFLLKTAKEHAEAQTRSKSEFLAYVCQGLRTPLNNIAGFAQVMRDQLYGPIENRKYRQYATDIFSLSNDLMQTSQNLATLSKMDAGYVCGIDKPQDIAGVINKALSFMSERIAAGKHKITLSIDESLPQLVANEFCLQQIIMNGLLYTLERVPDAPLTITARLLHPIKDRTYFAIMIATESNLPRTQEAVSTLVERATDPYLSTGKRTDDQMDTASFNIHYALVKALVNQYEGFMDISEPRDEQILFTVLFSQARIQANVV